jgi:4-aminobutyrate aminotransferase-like enzyme
MMFGSNHTGLIPDIMTIGKGMGGGFPVSGLVSTEEITASKPFSKPSSSSSSYGGNPLASTAALTTIRTIVDEALVENSRKVGAHLLRGLSTLQEKYEFIGDVRGRGLLIGVELVKDKATKEPFEQAGKLVYQKAFAKGLAWIPAGHILRMSPPIIMDEHYAAMGLDMIEDAIGEVEHEFGYTR